MSANSKLPSQLRSMVELCSPSPPVHAHGGLQQQLARNPKQLSSAPSDSGEECLQRYTDLLGCRSWPEECSHAYPAFPPRKGHTASSTQLMLNLLYPHARGCTAGSVPPESILRTGRWSGQHATPCGRHHAGWQCHASTNSTAICSSGAALTK